jgi:hypothetical protein
MDNLAAAVRCYELLTVASEYGVEVRPPGWADSRGAGSDPTPAEGN